MTPRCGRTWDRPTCPISWSFRERISKRCCAAPSGPQAALHPNSRRRRGSSAMSTAPPTICPSLATQRGSPRRSAGRADASRQPEGRGGGLGLDLEQLTPFVEDVAAAPPDPALAHAGGFARHLARHRFRGVDTASAGSVERAAAAVRTVGRRNAGRRRRAQIQRRPAGRGQIAQ